MTFKKSILVVISDHMLDNIDVPPLVVLVIEIRT